MAPIFTIVGATGTQGGAVLDTALKAGIYHIRAITRNPSSEKAKALVARGVEVVAADLDDEASLIKAFEGSTAIFALTNFFEPFATLGPKAALGIEIQQGTNLALAASKTASLQHYVWSTLPDSGSEMEVPHFRGKAKVDKLIKGMEGLRGKTTFLWVGFYSQNYLFPVFAPDLMKSSGKYAQLIPYPSTAPITSIGSITANLGLFTNAILAQPSLTHSRYVFAIKEITSLGNMLQEWSEVTGKESVYVQIGLQEYEALWPVWGTEMGVMFRMWEKVGAEKWGEREEGVLGWKDLGVDGEGLVGNKEALGGMDWSGL